MDVTKIVVFAAVIVAVVCAATGGAAYAQQLHSLAKVDNALQEFSWLVAGVDFDDLGHGYRRYSVTTEDGEPGVALVKLDQKLPTVLEVQVGGRLLSAKTRIEALVTADLDAFGKRSYFTDYHATHREEAAARARERYKKAPDKQKERSRINYEKNPDRMKQAAKKYQSANREEILAYKRDHYLKNRDMILAKRKARKDAETTRPKTKRGDLPGRKIGSLDTSALGGKKRIPMRRTRGRP